MGKMYYGAELSIEHNDDETLTVINYFLRKTFAIKDISAVHFIERKLLFNVITIRNAILFIETKESGVHMIAFEKEWEDDFIELYAFLSDQITTDPK
ncbi:MAG: hypothetical protein LBD23_04990 [Oscillospiraceae bacterium]|jgi:hypothetical protein|nr:hypothetical protein [Oscillospiraceae bacterium]